MTIYLHWLVEEQYVDKDKPLEGVKTWRSYSKKTGVTTYLSSTHWYPDDDGYEIKKTSSDIKFSTHGMFFT